MCKLIIDSSAIVVIANIIEFAKYLFTTLIKFSIAFTFQITVNKNWLLINIIKYNYTNVLIKSWKCIDVKCWWLFLISINIYEIKMWFINYLNLL